MEEIVQDIRGEEMEPKKLLEILSVAEKLKCNTRHCYTSSGRKESVAEHSWRLGLMAMLIAGEAEFQDADMNKVIQMCLIHDLGEAFTGDIPAFAKVESDSQKEEEIYENWVAGFPEPQRTQFQELLKEMEALETREAKIYKALDKLEAVIQHDESDIATWIPLEYDLQLEYGKEQVKFSTYFKNLKSVIDEWTKNKIAEAQK